MDQLRIRVSKSRVSGDWIVLYHRGQEAFVGLRFNTWQNAYNFCCGTWWYMNGTADDFVKAEVITWTKKLWTGEL